MVRVEFAEVSVFHTRPIAGKHHLNRVHSAAQQRSPPVGASLDTGSNNLGKGDCKIKGVTHAPSALCPLRRDRRTSLDHAACCSFVIAGRAPAALNPEKSR